MWPLLTEWFFTFITLMCLYVNLVILLEREVMTMAKKKSKGGRPSKYETHVKPYLNQIAAWARNGLVDEQIAQNLGVATSTFYEYKKKFPELSEALKTNKELADLEVENALRQRALGYEYNEITKELINGELVVTKVVTKQMAPDTTAQIFWLKNRRPDIWRDRHEVGHSGSMEINNPMVNLSDEELRKLTQLASDSE